MTIKQQGGIFGRNPTFNNLDVDGLANFNDTVRISKSSGTLLELYDADGGQDASTFSVTNGGRDMTIFAPQDTIFTQDGLETARFLDGGGLTFNGDTAAANALDDYEEGIFIATLTPATSGSITVTTTANELAYTKVGRQVFINGMVIIDSVSSPVGGSVKLNLPFTTANLADSAGRSAGVSVQNTSGAYLLTPIYSFEAVVEAQIIFDASTVTAAHRFYISLSYITA